MFNNLTSIAEAKEEYVSTKSAAELDEAVFIEVGDRIFENS